MNSWTLPDHWNFSTSVTKFPYIVDRQLSKPRGGNHIRWKFKESQSNLIAKHEDVGSRCSSDNYWLQSIRQPWTPSNRYRNDQWETHRSTLHLYFLIFQTCNGSNHEDKGLNLTKSGIWALSTQLFQIKIVQEQTLHQTEIKFVLIKDFRVWPLTDHRSFSTSTTNISGHRGQTAFKGEPY